jgi:hypothetical protein
MEITRFKKTPEDDCVEAEIVSGPGTSANTEGGFGHENYRERPAHNRHRRREPVNIPFYGLFLRLKFVFISATLLVSFGLIVLGLILISTFIGAIIGLPLLLLGGILLWLLFKLLTLGQNTGRR